MRGHTTNHFEPVFKPGFAVVLLPCASRRLPRPSKAMPISPSVVLVLKLVSSTHVKPTTGIVVSDEGLVLVPADFASGGGRNDRA